MTSACVFRPSLPLLSRHAFRSTVCTDQRRDQSGPYAWSQG
ncbi:hypothetical protein A176_006888 [Myxococcus hansupus]|uniref:Uncharacterized protein n=1 Tax=Pseudomyxococcus hansupus TaxID=1297742 RepID=A0A0H4X2V3_9BACT|nr:hypothetical protein A176_006888 [Myxococcus hansupus]